MKCFTVGNSYKLFSVTVRLFGGVNYLSVGQQSRIIPIDDIGIVAPLDAGDVDRLIVSHTMQGEIVAARCSTYIGCTRT